MNRNSVDQGINPPRATGAARRLHAKLKFLLSLDEEVTPENVYGLDEDFRAYVRAVDPDHPFLKLKDPAEIAAATETRERRRRERIAKQAEERTYNLDQLLQVFDFVDEVDEADKADKADQETLTA
ncbi:hypothetical protein MFIFM68171_03292 [Madurella fahalii]|uniref:Uncharacterized protein n=1 Tax=Madurella fahalii TaxID=1157608 RepID=A0ABQ0G5T0_9PEZI